MERSLWKEKDFLSSDVRGTFYSGRVPHNRCGEISFYRKELPFTRCEEILVFWKNSPHQVWRDLFLQKRTSFHQVWGNPCILEEFPTPGVWVSLWKERTSFHQVWGDPSILEEFTHTMCRGISLERRRLPFTMCEKVLLFWQSSPTPGVERSLSNKGDFLSPGVRKSFYSGRVSNTRCGEISLERKGLPFTCCEGILVF